MPIKYASFISYPHSTPESNLFVEQLTKKLEECTELFVREKIYLDKYYITKSSDIEKELAHAICKSACMVLVFSQLYEHKIWCLREFIAMEQIENKRKQILGNKYDRTMRMIIPIKLGAVDYLPPKINGIHYVDFPNFPRKSLNISRKEQEQLEKIAKVIYDHYRTLTNFIEETNDICDEYILPSEEDAKKLWTDLF